MERDAIVYVDVVFTAVQGRGNLLYDLVSYYFLFCAPILCFGSSFFIHNGRPHSLPSSSNNFILLGTGFSFFTFGGLTFGRASALGSIPPNDPNGGVSS